MVKVVSSVELRWDWLLNWLMHESKRSGAIGHTLISSSLADQKIEKYVSFDSVTHPGVAMCRESMWPIEAKAI